MRVIKTLWFDDCSTAAACRFSFQLIVTPALPYIELLTSVIVNQNFFHFFCMKFKSIDMLGCLCLPSIGGCKLSKANYFYEKFLIEIGILLGGIHELRKQDFANF